MVYPKCWKNAIPVKTVPQKWKRDENISQTKAKGVHHHKNCLIINAKGSSSSWNETTLNSNRKEYEHSKLSGKGKVKAKGNIRQI